MFVVPCDQSISEDASPGVDSSVTSTGSRKPEELYDGGSPGGIYVVWFDPTLVGGAVLAFTVLSLAGGAGVSGGPRMTGVLGLCAGGTLGSGRGRRTFGDSLLSIAQSGSK